MFVCWDTYSQPDRSLTQPYQQPPTLLVRFGKKCWYFWRSPIQKFHNVNCLRTWLTRSTMNFSDFLRDNQVAFVKPTANNNGLNFRTADGRLVATTLIPEVPAEEDILDWVKERFTWDCNVQESQSGNIILRVSKPRVVDYGTSLAGLFESPKATSKRKVKA